MSQTFGLIADGLVAVLLVAAIVTCLRVSRGLARFKADEPAMRATVASLVQATDAAERAIAGLRATLGDGERTLAERIRLAEDHGAALAAQVDAGEAVVRRLDQIADLSRRAAGGAVAAFAPVQPVAAKAPAAKPARSALEEVLASAQAVAERSARRLAASGRAAA